MADHDDGVERVQSPPDLEHIQREHHWSDPTFCSRWVGWQSPAYLLQFMASLDLTDPYYKMTPEEVHRLMEGEDKFVRILVLYARRYLEKRCRIRWKKGYLYYVSRSNYWVRLPAWVQEIERLEWDRPSNNFFELQTRIQMCESEWRMYSGTDHSQRDLG